MNRLFVLVMICWTWAVSGSVYALTLDAENGIEVLFVNGKPAQEGTAVHFSENKLQLVVRYEGRLKKNGGKPEFLSTTPYVLTLTSGAEANHGQLHVSLVSNRYHKIDNLNRAHKPVFNVSAGFPVKIVQQVVLPAKSKVFPYMNLGPLVADFNQTNKTVFADQPLGYVEKDQVKKSKQSATTVEQLKFWFDKASAQERGEFLRWAAKQ
ncbi:hypothetical protein VA7868_03450 [Vibrio aerogenes CECT 7868]|uniref:Uncharacterized protein n=1 Tax=Vibrio aerogenes CECT 7868 TaxID=1216006 RepID=A0A1M6A258_9VIBR|nr:DUF2057 family protein [Vibrio aerogenes]SHI30594.1 hypothetical protein VA7868_03450 [Vibrio aerogenes CECT 7868]